MKKVFTYTLAAMLIFTYVFSNVGFAVHKCVDTGSMDVVSLLADVSCEKIHGDSHSVQHQPCTSGNCTGHSSNCCNTEIYNLSPEQDVRLSIEFNKPLFPDNLFSFLTPEILPIKEVSLLNTSYYAYRESPSILSGKDKLSIISTWRL